MEFLRIFGKDPGHESANRFILYFFVKLVLLTSVWFVCYNLLLKPNRTIDRPLTNFITASVTQTINLVSSGAPISWEEDLIRNNRAHLIKDQRRVFGIHDVCNGIDLMFIYVGVIFLLPGSLKRKFVYAGSGILIIILANIIRVCLLYAIYVHYRTAFDFSHHYLFTILMYVLIFYGWLLFIKSQRGSQHAPIV